MRTMLRKKMSPRGENERTIFFASDLHGSEFVVPVVRGGGGAYRAEFHGQQERIDESTVADFERRAANSGLYTERMDQDEYQHYADHPDEVEQQITEIAPGMEMLSTGYTNVTPWDTHREHPEEEIRAHLKAMTDHLENPRAAIFNIHVPPYNSRLDTAPLLGQDLKVKSAAGTVMTAPVGSTSVREAIEEAQPLLSLHGHIHESGGSVRIGRTTAINVGSEYGEGILRGVLVTVGDGKLLGYQAVSG